MRRAVRARPPPIPPISEAAKLAEARCWRRITISADTVLKVRTLFHALDKDRSGTLTDEDVQPCGAWNDQSKQFFNSVTTFLHDEDGNGAIDEREFFQSFVKVGLQTLSPIAAGTTFTMAEWGDQIELQVNAIISTTVHTVHSAAQALIAATNPYIPDVNAKPFPGPELQLSDDVWDLMWEQFDSLDADNSGAVDRHEVPPEVWEVLENYFNDNDDEKIDRVEYVAAVKAALFDNAITIPCNQQVSIMRLGTMRLCTMRLCTMRLCTVNSITHTPCPVIRIIS
jgi:Ca2+-binding EF-hand superfamily protein